MREPFGKPGLAPNWSRASKHGVGTACNPTSRVWFTMADGVVTEVFYPTVDTANTKDVQFLITDGKTFFNEEKKDTLHAIEYIDPGALAFRVTNTAKNSKYRIVKSIVTDPGGQSLVIKVSFEPHESIAGDLKLFILFAPHIKNMGYANSGRVLNYRGRDFLVAWRDDIAGALTADVGFLRSSVGYSGFSDGWDELRGHFSLNRTFEGAGDGNIALVAELDLSKKREFTLCLSFSSSETGAIMEALKTMERGYASIEEEYIKGWRGYLAGLKDLSGASGDGGALYRKSAMVLKAHEDKTHGGVIASLSIPWGEAKGDGESAGYHLVWPRDLVNAAFAFMAMGDMAAPVRILGFLAGTQRGDGSWPQNMWLDGRPYWTGVQLDEVALPVVLAWRLKKMGAVGDEYYLMCKKAAGYLLSEGPITEQDRWEEQSGFSPSTLAAEVSALVCAASWAQEVGEEREAGYMLETADYWASRVEAWTFSDCDCLGEAMPGHYMRIVSEPRDNLPPAESLCHAEVFLKNVPADAPHHQGEIIDVSFLSLVRYGLRSPADPHVTGTLRLVDAMLKKDFPYGPLFHRYNNDGYGEKPDGSAFDGSGIGRPWPLLTGERGLYEVMAGGNYARYIKAIEGSANEGGMIPEQVWDADDIEGRGLYYGKGTGAATPLMWAHAEYIKLLRSASDASGCDLIPEVNERYSLKGRTLDISAWKRNKPIRWTLSNYTLRIVEHESATLVWSADDWKTKNETRLAPTGLGVFYTDFKPGAFGPGTTLAFTFHYPEEERWEGKNHEINIV